MGAGTGPGADPGVTGGRDHGVLHRFSGVETPGAPLNYHKHLPDHTGCVNRLKFDHRQAGLLLGPRTISFWSYPPCALYRAWYSHRILIPFLDHPLLDLSALPVYLTMAACVLSFHHHVWGSFMVSERIQRRIYRLLDQIEEAVPGVYAVGPACFAVDAGYAESAE